jgi:hypothetical protein
MFLIIKDLIPLALFLADIFGGKELKARSVCCSIKRAGAMALQPTTNDD